MTSPADLGGSASSGSGGGVWTCAEQVAGAGAGGPCTGAGGRDERAAASDATTTAAYTAQRPGPRPAVPASSRTLVSTSRPPAPTPSIRGAMWRTAQAAMGAARVPPISMAATMPASRPAPPTEAISEPEAAHATATSAVLTDPIATRGSMSSRASSTGVTTGPQAPMSPLVMPPTNAATGNPRRPDPRPCRLSRCPVDLPLPSARSATADARVAPSVPAAASPLMASALAVVGDSGMAGGAEARSALPAGAGWAEAAVDGGWVRVGWRRKRIRMRRPTTRSSPDR